MLIKQECVLVLLPKLVKHASVAKTVDITQLDDPILFISSEREIVLMIQAADLFVKNNNSPSSFQANFFLIDAEVRLQRLPVCDLNQDQEKFMSYALFPDTNVQQTEIIFHSILSLLISTMRPFDYDARTDRRVTRKSLGYGERFLLKVERHYTGLETSISDQGVIAYIALTNSARKWSLWDKGDRHSAHMVEIINLHDLKLPVLPRKGTRTERSTTR